MCKITPRSVLEETLRVFQREAPPKSPPREPVAAPEGKTSPTAPPGRPLGRGPDNRVRRCRAFLGKLPPSVEGEHGSDRMIHAARVAWNDFGLDEAEGYPLLQEYNARANPPWPEEGSQGLRRKWSEAVKMGPGPEGRGWRLRQDRPGWKGAPTGTTGGERATAASPDAPDDVQVGEARFRDTDLANGRRFVKEHAGGAIFVADMRRWFVHVGSHWAEDVSGMLVKGLAQETVTRMADEALEQMVAAAKLTREAQAVEEQAKAKEAMAAAKKALEWAKVSQDVKRMNAMVDAAAPSLLAPKVRDVFDGEPHLLNCVNGTVDLRTGELRPHRREDYITKVCPTKYDPAAAAPAYLGFLGAILPAAEAEYVRRFSGLAVTGEVTSQTLHLGNGRGSNGKTVLLQTWVDVMGEYAVVAPSELVADAGEKRHPTEKTVLRGRRLAVCEETDEDESLNVRRVKQLTGGGDVTARGMRQDFYTFPATHKLFLSTNCLPRVRAVDHGTWRRVRVIEFPRIYWTEGDRLADPEGDRAGKFPAHRKADEGLKEKLSREHEGILADMVSHAIEFYAGGRKLDPPPEVMRHVTNYRQREDTVGRWLAEFVRARSFEDCRGEKGKPLYDAFCRWYDAEIDSDEKKRPSAWKFYQRLQDIFENRTLHGSTVYAVEIVRCVPQDRQNRTAA